ncbi:hypothetical protein GCM10018773_00820 [Streptomyces candidus]|nr:hypothetical protein GCM10018773_00820 [Streptomyces candidus]
MATVARTTVAAPYPHWAALGAGIGIRFGVWGVRCMAVPSSEHGGGVAGSRLNPTTMSFPHGTPGKRDLTRGTDAWGAHGVIAPSAP